LVNNQLQVVFYKPGLIGASEYNQRSTWFERAEHQQLKLLVQSNFSLANVSIELLDAKYRLVWADRQPLLNTNQKGYWIAVDLDTECPMDSNKSINDKNATSVACSTMGEQLRWSLRIEYENLYFEQP